MKKALLTRKKVEQKKKLQAKQLAGVYYSYKQSTPNKCNAMSLNAKIYMCKIVERV